jgi:general secretion pathway protein D
VKRIHPLLFLALVLICWTDQSQAQNPPAQLPARPNRVTGPPALPTLPADDDTPATPPAPTRPAPNVPPPQMRTFQLPGAPATANPTPTNATASPAAAPAVQLPAIPGAPAPTAPPGATGIVPPPGATGIVPPPGATGVLPPPTGNNVVQPAPNATFPAFPGQFALPTNLPNLPGTPVPPPPASTNADELLNYKDMPLEAFVDRYAQAVGRTVIRPSALPQLMITLKSTTPLTHKEAVQAMESVMVVNGYTFVPLGDKFVTFVVNNLAGNEAARFSEAKTEDIPESIQYVTQIVRLDYVKPSDVLPAIQPFARNPNGILPIEANNILVIRDYAVNVKRILEVIAKIDVQIDVDYKLEVIPIRFGRVEDIYSTMNSLITGQAGGTGTGTTGTTGRRGTAGRGTGLNNTGINGQQGINGQPGVIGQQAAAGRGANQNSFQNRINQIANRAAAGGDLHLLGDARIVPDERSNSLIVFANKQDMEMITNIVAKVDVLLAQVLIEAIIVDVQIDTAKTVGISGVQYGKQSGKLTTAGGSSNGQKVLSNILGGGTNGVTDFASALPGGFSYFARFGGDWEAAIQAIATDSHTEVLQTPRIQTTHAVPASFFNGETVPYINSSYSGGGAFGGSSSYSQLRVGLQLDVTPYITPDGLVVMDISQTIDELSGTTHIDNVGDVPNTSSRNASSTISVKNQ